MKSNCPQGKQTFFLFCVSSLYVYLKLELEVQVYSIFFAGAGASGKKAFKVLYQRKSALVKLSS